MTGPQHYAEAERLLSLISDGDQNAVAVQAVTSAAQVHATLAGVVTYAFAHSSQLSLKDASAWREIAS